MITRKPRVVRTTAARRQEIVEAAYQCLKDEGYAALTARKVAARAGISLGHITYHFHSMTEVLAETYLYASKQLADQTFRLTNLPELEPLDRLQRFLAAGFTASILERGHLRVRIDLWSAAIAHPEIATLERRLYAHYRDNLLVHLTAIGPGCSPRDHSIVCDAIMAMLDGMWIDWLRRQDKDALDRCLAGCMRLAESLANQPAAGAA